MKCIDCKWYAGQVSDRYGVCKRFPHIENKSQEDWCGEFSNKYVNKKPIELTVNVPNGDVTYDITTDEFRPKRGRKPKNAN